MDSVIKKGFAQYRGDQIKKGCCLYGRYVNQFLSGRSVIMRQNSPLPEEKSVNCVRNTGRYGVPADSQVITVGFKCCQTVFCFHHS